MSEPLQAAAGSPQVERARASIRVRRFAGTAAQARMLARPVRVVHLTDLHVGRVTPRAVHDAAVRIANAERPDLVAITGDFVCHSLRHLDALEEVIAAIDAPVVAVLGNHDHWAGADAVTRALVRAGAIVLRNAHTTLTVGGEQLQIVGVDDAFTRHADVERATRGLRADVATLGLSHIGEQADALWKRGVPLVLSGHTHAGQIAALGVHRFFVGRLAGHRYVHGLYGDRAADRAVYVGAGIGASFIPFRLGAPASREVTVFELGAEAS
jgi:hypothetical protein